MAVRVGREEAVASMSEIFRRYGYEGASLKRLSDASGLGRSSLYHHFPNGKEDMAAAVRDWIVEQASARATSRGSTQRRLNRREFSAALRDLTGVPIDFGAGLPVEK